MPATTLATADAISLGETERNLQELLHLWLESWFDGAAHAISSTDPEAGNQTFALCDLFCGVAVLPPNAPRPQIHTTLLENEPVRRWRTGPNTMQRQRRFRWLHTVRVAIQGQDDPTPDRRCRKLGDQLKLLYESEPSLALARKGLLDLEIVSGPVQVPMPGYSVRQLTVRGMAILDQSLPLV